MNNPSRVTTKAFYEELQRLSERRENDMAQMRSTLQAIQNKVDNLLSWAFGSTGEKGLDQRMRLIEDQHIEERGQQQAASRFWSIAQQIIAFSVGLLGAVIGALL